MGHSHGMSLQLLLDRHMRRGWDSQLDVGLLQINQKRKIIFMQTLKSAFVREQIVMIY
jgi:hypothetical protein